MTGLRVLLVGINFPPEPTGIAPYTGGLARGLGERGHDVHVLTTYPHYPQWRVAPGWSGLTTRREVDGVDVVRLRHYVPSTPVGLRRAASELSFGARATLRRWGRPDVVLCPSPALLSTAAVLARLRVGRARPAVGVIVQDLYSAGMTETGGGAAVAGALGRVEGAVLRAADGVSVIHDRMGAAVSARFGVAPERLTVIRNWTHVAGPATADRGATRSRLGWADDETVVLHTGAMGEKQGLSNVVDAARLADEAGSRVRFVLVGDGGQRRALEERGRGVARLDFLPPVPAEGYADLLAAADVLLVNELPGLAEMALPSKLTSYFASSVCVLAATSTGSSTAHEVEASGAGRVVRPGDPAALLAGVTALVTDPDARRLLGRAGPGHVARELTEGAALDAYDTWVRDLCRTSLGIGRSDREADGLA